VANRNSGQSVSSPIALLRNTQQAAQENPLFQVEVETRREAFVGFSLCGTDYLAPLSSVPEIIRIPENFVPVPGVKKWMAGLANVRGTLLPLVDFQQFLCQQPVHLSSAARVLVIDHADLRTGLIVPMAHGLIYLDSMEQLAGEGESIRAEEREWQLLDMEWLVTNRDFRQAAA
jgi:twitching motility protein PilI